MSMAHKNKCQRVEKKMFRRLVSLLLSQSSLATKTIIPTTAGVPNFHFTTATKVQFARMAGKYTALEKGAANSTDYRVFFSE